MTTMASQITSLTVVYLTVYSDADQRKHQSSASLAFVWGIHRDRWIPRTKGQLRGKCFHLMTSSCILTKFSSFPALEVVILTTFCAARYDNFVNGHPTPRHQQNGIKQKEGANERIFCYLFSNTFKHFKTHWGRNKMAAIFQTTFSSTFSLMKMYEFRLRFHWSQFPMV